MVCCIICPTAVSGICSIKVFICRKLYSNSCLSSVTTYNLCLRTMICTCCRPVCSSCIKLNKGRQIICQSCTVLQTACTLCIVVISSDIVVFICISYRICLCRKGIVGTLKQSIICIIHLIRDNIGLIICQ